MSSKTPAVNAAYGEVSGSQQGNPGVSRAKIRVRGREALVPSVRILDRTVIVSGRWPKFASIHDEHLVEGETVGDPRSFVEALKRTGLRADVFTFAQKLPDTKPRHPYPVEWDNLAVIPITTFSDWWERRISGERGVIRNSIKEGIVVKQVKFDDAFVREMIEINNETPVRQGRPFWHFNKSFDTVKAENSTYPERNVFLGAYDQDKLIGFVRLICCDKIAHVLHFLVTMKRASQSPASVMMAETVKVCEQSGITHLVYGQYIYKDPSSSLTEFKRRRGFEQMLVPRYFIPLTPVGAVALKLGLHHGFSSLIPKPLLRWLLRCRKSWYALRVRAHKAGS